MEDEEEGRLVRGFNNDRWLDSLKRLHRLNGPARIWHGRDKEWYRHGMLHRDDGPALIYYMGKELCEYWYKDGKPYEPSAHEIMVWKMKKKEG